jgi:hypothetical protein
MDELSWADGLVTVDSRVDRTIVGALRGQDLSGFEIWHWLGSGEATAGLLTEAGLYPKLYRLEAENLVQSDWRERERTRRTYRLTSTAIQRADENGWPPIVFRGRADGQVEPGRAARTFSPDPDSGSWFVPPKEEADPATVEPLATAATGPRLGDSGNAAFARYVEDLGSSLDLPRVERSRVCQEVADHLDDSARDLELSGWDPDSAPTEAIHRLGPALDLARRVERAQHTQDRHRRAVRRAAIDVVIEIILWLILSAAALAVAPGVANIVIALGSSAGLHLAVLESAQLATNQVAMALCVGAFAAGRESLGRLARVSRHREATLRKGWALRGAVAVLAIGLLLPGYQDGLVVATLLVAPLAFVAGTFRAQQAQKSTYSLRGIGSAILAIAAVTLLPAGRLFAFDPNGTPGTPLTSGLGSVELSVVQQVDGSFDYGVNAPAGTGAVTVELWPVSIQGPFIVVDPAATSPAKADVNRLDLSTLPPDRPWWIVAVSTGPDGRRAALVVAIQEGAPGNPGTALGWLISKL